MTKAKINNLPKKLKYKQGFLVYFPNEDYQNDFQNKLKEFNQVGECYAHEKTQTTTDIIKKSERIRFGYLRYV